MPCIGQSVTFDFCDAYLLHSNLGGQGPDASAPESIRYVNVARVTDEEGSVMHFDLELTATSGYRPFNSSRNGLHGCFANVNLDCNEDVELTVTMRRSCATARSCKPCIDPALSAEQRISCFAAGCACYGKTVYAQRDCMDATEAANKAAYACDEMDLPIVLPREALVSFAVFDFDTGPSGTYLEQLTVPDYEYFKTPLRPTSGEAIESTIFVNEATRTFTSTGLGDSSNNPVDPTVLTNEQAARGVQLFFRPKYGYIEVTFKVTYTGSGACTGRNLLFAGDSLLCEAPPPVMPSLPPSPAPAPAQTPEAPAKAHSEEEEGGNLESLRMLFLDGKLRIVVAFFVAIIVLVALFHYVALRTAFGERAMRRTRDSPTRSPAER